MILDAADLALLEIEIENLSPIGREVAQLLIDRIRGDADAVDASRRALEVIDDHAKDAEIALDHLRQYINDEADKYADTIEESLDAVRRHE